MNKDDAHHITLSKFLALQIRKSGKTQRQIANEIDLPNPNVIAMLANGTMRLPVFRVSALANSLNIDAIHLLRMTLRAYEPETLDAIENLLRYPLLTSTEVSLINKLRDINPDGNMVAVIAESDNSLRITVC